MTWPTHLRTVRRSITAIKVVAVLVLVEQSLEVLFLGISLAEHPTIAIAALIALGFPVPGKPPEQP
jgi:hypothetical protein